MNHTHLIDTYATRALHFATRDRIHREGLARCKAAGLKASARDHAAASRRARAAVIAAAEVVVAELTLKAAADRLASSWAVNVLMPDPFNPSRGAKAYWTEGGNPAAYFLPLA